VSARRKRRKREEARDAADLGPEERARQLADAKASFVSGLVGFVVTVGILVHVAPPAAAVVGFFWGLHLIGHFTNRILEPALRRRWVAREVQRSASAQRRQLGGEHARHMEELSASIAHEIRNPITAAKSLVEQMGEEPASEESVGYARVALEELNRVERSISHLLRFAREEDLQLREARVGDVVDSALGALSDRLRRNGIEVVTEIGTDQPLLVDPEKLRRVILNLVSNALDALEPGATPAPRVEVKAGENLAGSEVWIRVRDNGPGMGPDELKRIFNPFHTGRSEGTGLGLAITQKLVNAHGGSIEVDSQPGRGTEFVVTLPRDGSARERP